MIIVHFVHVLYVLGPWKPVKVPPVALPNILGMFR